MRIALLLLVASCAESFVATDAGKRLGVHGKHLHMVTHDQVGDREVYIFCRSEREHDIGGFIPTTARSYDGACVTYVCPIGEDGKRCE
jgi:hypothetical protein